jgi:glucose-6-phosphate 1-dehydrogenase
MIRHFVILGASGDLTGRYLAPAIARLQHHRRLSGKLQITGIARDAWTTADFRRHLEQKLEQHAADLPASARVALVSGLEYRRADVSNQKELGAALGDLHEPLVAYLALPPALFGPSIEALAALGLPAESRIVVEKPFGLNLASAQDLNRLLHRSFREEAIFRLDHFLGKQTVQNIIGLRFANRVFEPLWSRAHLRRVEIVWDETLALEGRASYYDSAGALLDMIQNHLLQLLCLVGMEAPITLGERDLRDRKVDLLRAVRRLSPEEVERQTVRARYAAGRIGDQEISAYVDEKGIDPSRGAETFAAVTITVDNWRWAGVPFLLRTGKALAKPRKEIIIHFQPVPHLAFGLQHEPAPNLLRIQIDPDRVELQVSINQSGDPFCLEEIALGTELARPDLQAYGRLLLDVIEGQPTFAIRGDEAEESWRIIEPILSVWRQGRPPLLEYPAGSEGPGVPVVQPAG